MRATVICELGCNHGGSVDVANTMIVEAAACGVDIVKGQKRCIRECLTDEQYNRPYSGPHSFGDTYGQHREALELSVEDWKWLKKVAEEQGTELAMSVFDVTSAREMAEIGIRTLKVGSGNIHDRKLVEVVGELAETMIVSLGMSTAAEVEELIEFATEMSRAQTVVWMQTTSAYPCPEEDVHLRVIPWLLNHSANVGLSGHYVNGSGSIEAAAVALGARWIERHFTLDRASKGTDHAASLESPGLTRVVKAIRTVERAFGRSVKMVELCEEPVRAKCRGN